MSETRERGTMASSFAVTTSSGSVRLDEARRSSVSYTVTNQRGQACRGRVTLVPLEGAQAGWFQIAGLRERSFAAGETHHFPVEINVPSGVPAATYALRLDIVAEDNPDEDYTHGPAVAFAAAESAAPPPPERTGYLRTIAGTAIGGLTGLAAGAILALVIGAVLALLADDLDDLFGALVITLLLFIPGPWLGAAAGSWLALRMGGYGHIRTTGLLVAGIFPLWALLHFFIIAQLSNSNRIDGGVLFLIVLLIVAPSWVIVPALAARFTALRIGGSEAVGAPNRNQPAAT
jgi:hypothetical protein